MAAGVQGFRLRQIGHIVSPTRSEEGHRLVEREHAYGEDETAERTNEAAEEDMAGPPEFLFHIF